MYEVNFLLKWKIWRYEVAGLSTRSDKLKSELRSYRDLIKGKEIGDRQSYQRYTKQQGYVREFNSLTKEVEFPNLIQLAESK
jgi:Skp family chaperone for outer membrane proteins